MSTDTITPPAGLAPENRKSTVPDTVWQVRVRTRLDDLHQQRRASGLLSPLLKRRVESAVEGVQAQRPAPVGQRGRGLVPGRAGSRRYLGQPDTVRWHDPVTGAELDSAAVPGLAAVRGLAGQA